ncbi:MAG: hypothetical protein AB7O43_23450, partial [Hyphomicrobiaceae bacterium]
RGSATHFIDRRTFEPFGTAPRLSIWNRSKCLPFPFQDRECLQRERFSHAGVSGASAYICGIARGDPFHRHSDVRRGSLGTQNGGRVRATESPPRDTLLIRNRPMITPVMPMRLEMQPFSAGSTWR